jgi:hypothetical protein
MEPEAAFLKYKNLAEAYWRAVDSADFDHPGRRRPSGIGTTASAAELREQLALMLPEVEEAARDLEIQYIWRGRAPSVVGGFPIDCNMFKAAYDRSAFAASVEEVRDFLNECVGRARKGKRPRMTPFSVGTKVVVGHGGSLVWRELKDFIKDRCGLEPDEYNLIATAGLSRKERLQQMLNEAAFAFLVLTAEDEQPDGKVRARENVVHEVGLFQGRLGFTKAIVLLEDGCEQFSNIDGLDQIRFPKGKIAFAFEEVRRGLGTRSNSTAAG